MDIQTLVNDATVSLATVLKYELVEQDIIPLVAGARTALVILQRLLAPDGVLDPVAVMDLEKVWPDEWTRINGMRKALGLDAVKEEYL